MQMHQFLPNLFQILVLYVPIYAKIFPPKNPVKLIHFLKLFFYLNCLTCNDILLDDISAQEHPTTFLFSPCRRHLGGKSRWIIIMTHENREWNHHDWGLTSTYMKEIFTFFFNLILLYALHLWREERHLSK